ncbi:MAG: glucose-6-phosphate isomerase [Chloroflexi bacterium]|nr:glucose-6-phosphate isomerase [Chloroflexota bacterium]
MDTPFANDLIFPQGIPSKYDNYVIRKLSSLRGQFNNLQAYEQMLAKEDTVIYEVYEVKRPEIPGELLHGVSIIHPGKVGNEFFMTKGHFHATLETAEVYYGLKGQGMLVLELPEGDWAVEEMRPGRVVYIPPRWAHRTVNTGQEDLAFLAVYPANAGHDYGTIEDQGFRKLVVEENGQIRVVDNPHWHSPDQRS